MAARLRSLALAGVVGACGGGASGTATSAPGVSNAAPADDPGAADAGPACDDVLPAVVTRLFEDQVDPVQRDQLADALVARCDEDAWGAPVRACLGAAASPEAASDCGSLLTPAQMASLERMLGAEFGASLSDLEQGP
jgi:hypothetical protein